MMTGTDSCIITVRRQDPLPEAVQQQPPVLPQQKLWASATKAYGAVVLAGSTASALASQRSYNCGRVKPNSYQIHMRTPHYQPSNEPPLKPEPQNTSYVAH